MTRTRYGTATLVLLVLTAACGAAFLIQGIRLPRLQQQYLDRAWRQEVETVQALAGAILAAHPELEPELAAALREENPTHREMGAQALDKYGYRAARGFGETERYHTLQGQLALAHRVFVLSACLLAGLLLAWKISERRDGAAAVSAVLDSYLSGDFSFARATPGGRRTGASSSLREGLRRLGNQIRLHQAQLTEEKESTKALVTDISHQLKTPIAALRTCFSLFLEAETTEERQEFQGRCLQQMDKLEGLTGALMNISRLEAAMITLTPEPVNLQDVLMTAVNGIFDKAADKDIGVELSPFPPLTLELDRRWTAEAFLNVLDNAVKYSPSGTAVLIRVQARQSFVRVEIADRGIGIPAEEHSRIFQRFYRGGHDVVRAAEGAGVGLYLTRSILESQGGSIHVCSAPGEGATFVIQLYARL